MIRNSFGLVAAILTALLLAACSPKTPQATEAALPPAGEEQGAAVDPQPSEDQAGGADTAASQEESAPAGLDGQALFDKSGCADCHGEERQGLFAPPLLPETLTNDPSFYINTITNGRSRMPAFGNDLSTEEIAALVDWLRSPLP